MLIGKQGLDYNTAVNQYFSSGDLDSFSLDGGGSSGGASSSRGRRTAAKSSATEEKCSKRRRLGNPLLQYTEQSGDKYSVHYGSFPPDAFAMELAYMDTGEW